MSANSPPDGGVALHQQPLTKILILATVTALLAVHPSAQTSGLYGDPKKTRCITPATREQTEKPAPAKSGSFSSGTVPERMQAYSPSQWSDAAYLDLTDAETIPHDAVVKSVRIHYDRTVGGFAMPNVAIFDEDGKCFYFNEWSRQTDALSGLPVRQRWRVQFWTRTIWDGPARLWPRVTITYEH